MKTKQKNKEVSKTAFSRLNDQIIHNKKNLIIIAAAFYLLLSFFTFNLRISEGGDDSAYIIRALQLLEEGRFPRFQGPLYPITLTVFVAFFGLNTLILKISSWAFLTLSLLFLWKAYAPKVSAITLFGTIFLLIFNHHFLYFASQTYSEAFFMAIQGVFLLYLFHTIEWQKDQPIKISQAAILSILLIALFLTRTVALIATPAVLIYFALQKQKRAFLLTASFVLIFISAYFLFSNLISETTGTGNEQLTSLMQKHPYDKTQGMESLSGFLMRFWENSKIYLSKHFMILTGFKQAMSLTKPALPALLLYLTFILGIVRFFRTNQKILFFTGIYIALSVGLTFFALQPLWDQVRLIIPFFPLILIFLIKTLCDYFEASKYKWKQKVPITLILAAIILTGVQTIKQTDFSTIFKNIKGETLYGYTPDWQNYLKMSRYIAEELPNTAYVACRKPNMARLHSGGKKFYGIYNFNSENPDTLLMQLQRRNVTHIMVASLRKNPRMKTGQVINTIHRYMSFIAKKYPETFILRKEIGKDEKSWLFEINYAVSQANQPPDKSNQDTN